MKFPQSNTKKRGNEKETRKTVNPKVSLSKPIKNQRNIIQQQRVNTVPTGKKVRVQRAQANQPKEQEQYDQNNYEDEVEGLDANEHINANGLRGKKGSDDYNRLMEESGKGFKRLKNKYFLESQKYQGKRQEEEDEAEELEDEEMMDQEELDQNSQNSEDAIDSEQPSQDQDQQQEDEQSANNEIQQALSELKNKRNSTSKLINSQLESINLEDKQQITQIIKSKSKTTKQQHQEAMQLRKLLEVYDRLVELRYGQQKELQQMKKYPKMNQEAEIPSYPPMSHELFTVSKQLEMEMIGNLSQYLALFKNFAQKTLCTKIQSNVENKDSEIDEEPKDELQETTIDLEALIQAQIDNNKEQDSLASGRLNVDKIYTLIKSTISNQTSAAQKQLIKWSQKTSFLSTTTPAHKLSSLIMQTPVGQAKKVMQNWERLANKCQQKRGNQLFKILFESEDNIHELSDPQIYDDYDLFIELEKYYLERLNDDNEDGEFLQSATMKYLKNKQANQLAHDKKQKQVDRKASKNRKIRFNVHTKLLNFMPSCQENVIETRDEIVRNMFNCNARINEDALEGNVGKYRRGEEELELIDVE